MEAGSRTILVRKRDGGTEAFDRGKLAGALWAAMRAAEGRYRDARDLAAAMESFLRRHGLRCVSSAVLFEMSLIVLRRVLLSAAADAMEAHRDARMRRRRHLRVRHEDGQLTWWAKGWLSEVARRRWGISQPAARIIAGHVESALLDGDAATIDRQAVMDLLCACVADHALADEPSVRHPAPPDPTTR